MSLSSLTFSASWRSEEVAEHSRWERYGPCIRMEAGECPGIGA